MRNKWKWVQGVQLRASKEANMNFRKLKRTQGRLRGISQGTKRTWKEMLRMLCRFNMTSNPFV